jgi:DNA-binding transcriptional LysR family regulator
VRLTASEVVSAYVLPPILAALAARHPEIEVELVASDRVDNLLEREADIAVRMLRPTQGSLITRHLADWPLGFYAHADYLARAAAPVDRRHLAQQRWIGHDQSTQLIDGFRAAGIKVDRSFFGFRCDKQIVGFEALRAALGIGLALVPLAERAAGLQRVLHEQALPALPVWLTAHRELRASPRLRRVFDHLADELVRWGKGPARRAPNARR